MLFSVKIGLSLFGNLEAFNFAVVLKDVFNGDKLNEQIFKIFAVDNSFLLKDLINILILLIFVFFIVLKNRLG